MNDRTQTAENRRRPCVLGSALSGLFPVVNFPFQLNLTERQELDLAGIVGQ